MNEVFINYRTGDGDEAAVIVEQALSRRFGEERIFRAAKSVKPGHLYPDALIRAVQRCSVLIAIIGPNWARDPRLQAADDWVRREILEAYGQGIPVIPVLKGRATERLSPAGLPSALRWLADAQSLRLDTRDNRADLTRLGDELSDRVPALKKADRTASSPLAHPTVQNSVGEVHGATVQSSEIRGDAGNVFKGNHGPIHAGTGDQNNMSFTGDGTTYIKGDNHGGIGHHFGGLRKREDEDEDKR